jgi:hypothetical protein
MDTIAKPNGSPTQATPPANRKTCKGAEIMVDYLIKEEVPYLVGVGGHGNIGFLDAVRVFARHERGEHISDRLKDITGLKIADKSA